jgi:galactokinase
VAQIISKAPGRICLFGDHQDYLGLPVIACAIDRFVTVEGLPNHTDYFKITLPDLNEELKIRFRIPEVQIHEGEHLKAALNVVKRYGCNPDSGYDIVIQGDIPINAGLSSSSAMVVAWVQWLFVTFGCEHEITLALIGQVAYEAEVLEQNSPGGKMDQYTSALGNIIYLETGSDTKVMKLGTRLNGLIIAESGIPKDTIGLLDTIRTKAVEALSFIMKNSPDFDIHKATLTDYENHKGILSEALRPYFFAAIKNHLITQEALLELQQNDPDLAKLGKLMNDHHEILKNILQITVPRIDAMVSAALDAGAYGAKIVGSGGGGSIVAISDPKKMESVVKAIKKAGAQKAYAVDVTNGAHYIND